MLKFSIFLIDFPPASADFACIYVDLFLLFFARFLALDFVN